MKISVEVIEKALVSSKASPRSRAKINLPGNGVEEPLEEVPNLFGCSVGGIPLISAMYSLPHVMKRVKAWGEGLKKVRWFIEEMERLPSVMLIGERPHRHHLLHFEAPIFWEVSRRHKRKGFFLADEVIRRGIAGLHRGLNKHVKLSIYGLSWMK
jgi:Sep-tRNA:Cys-tRNA synthetase